MSDRVPWRAAYAGDSMRPALEPGDFVLLDRDVRAWPPKGSIVVVRQPRSDIIAIKRVAAGPGEDVLDAPGGRIRLGPDEAWVTGDQPEGSLDSRRYGPVPLERLVARAWFRYWPIRRLGRLR